MRNESFVRLIKERRTIRKFRKEIPPAKDIEMILNAACYAPYGGGTESWKFIRIRDRIKILKMAEALKNARPEITYEFGTYFKDAPIVIAVAWKPVCSPPRPKEISLEGTNVWAKYKEDVTVGLMSAAHAIQNVLLGSAALGLGAGYVGPFYGDIGFEKILALEKPYKVSTIIPIGYAADEKPKKQKDTSELIMIV